MHAAAVAALSRPNGVIVVLALLIAVGFVFRRVVAVMLPVVVALAGWVWYNALRTGDPLKFFDAKGAWHEVTIFNFVSQVSADAVLHLAIATLAVVLVVLVRRRIPTSWLWYTILGLAPSLVFGVVGLARYATDSFPPTIAAAMLLDRGAASTRRNVLISLVVVQITLAVVLHRSSTTHLSTSLLPSDGRCMAPRPTPSRQCRSALAEGRRPSGAVRGMHGARRATSDETRRARRGHSP